MPKLKASDLELKRRVVQSHIAKYMALRGINEETLAVKIGCAKRTLQNKRKRPETFTVGELWKIYDVLKITDDDAVEVLSNGRSR